MAIGANRTQTANAEDAASVLGDGRQMLRGENHGDHQRLSADAIQLFLGIRPSYLLCKAIRASLYLRRILRTRNMRNPQSFANVLLIQVLSLNSPMVSRADRSMTASARDAATVDGAGRQR